MWMSGDLNRKLAEAARAAAAATSLPNVRERELRSAAAYEAMANRGDKLADRKKGDEGAESISRVADLLDDIDGSKSAVGSTG
jgi:hypothetical protein